MATIDQILDSLPDKENTHPAPAATPIPTPTTTPDTAAMAATPAAPAQDAQQATTQGGQLSYLDIFKQLNPYTPPTSEHLENEKKREKRQQIFAAIGDGVSALSNLYFTTQGAPNMYTGHNTMSAKNKERWDRLKDERKVNNTAYFNGFVKAQQADDGKYHADKTWLRTLGLDQQERDRFNANIKHRDDREAIADKRYDDDKGYKKTRDALGDVWMQKEFDQREKQHDRQNEFAILARKDNKELQEKRIIATGAKAVRGKQLGFADGAGNQVGIYENVWKGSMQQVYDVIVADFNEQRKTDKSVPYIPTKSSTADKDSFVKQNWHKSPKASQIMLTLSNLDPATMNSELNNEDFSQFQEVDDDFSQYKQK